MSALTATLKAQEFHFFDEVLTLVSAFENGTLPRAQWTHRAHLTVACWYLISQADSEAIPRIREGIKKYNVFQGIITTKDGGYHETITMFWAKMVRSFLAKSTLECSIVQLINNMIAQYADKNLPFEYYSRDRLLSWEARTSWLEPDLKPLFEAGNGTDGRIYAIGNV